jgi:hypothetical protein
MAVSEPENPIYSHIFYFICPVFNGDFETRERVMGNHPAQDHHRAECGFFFTGCFWYTIQA